MLTLARALIDYEADLLQIIAAQWDIDLPVGSRELLAEELAEAMAQPEAVNATWVRLGEDEQQALFTLQAQEGRMPFTHFTRLYGDIRPMGPARREREKPWLKPDGVTEALYYKGLITRAFERTIAGAQAYIVIPSDLADLLPQPERDSVLPAPGYPVAPPRKFRGGHGIAADDVATLLAYLRIRDVHAQPWLETQPDKSIDRHLRRSRSKYRAFLTHLLYDLELIYDEAILTHVATKVNKESVRPWLEAPRVHQLRSLAETWLASTSWNDLACTPGLEADEWPNDPRLARQAILAALQQVPAEIWWSLDGLVEHVKQHNPDFQRAGGAWYLRDRYTGEILQGFQYWDYIEGALIRFIVKGPMRWLGLVHSGRGAFLLTPLGRALLGQESWPSTPDPDTHIRVDDQGTISIPVHLSRYDRLQIARFSAWVSTPSPTTNTPSDPPWDDGVYQYRLTPQSLTRAAQERIKLDTHVIPFLNRLSEDGLSPKVLQMLTNWQAQPREVVVEDVVIITAKDLGIDQRLRSHQPVSRWLEQQVGPHAHVVKRENLQNLLNALREMGILPLFEGYEKDDWP